MNGTAPQSAPVDTRLSGAPSPRSAEQIRAVIARSRAAQRGWYELGLGARKDLLTLAAKAMLRDRARVIALAKEEIGKYDVDALFTEGLGPLDTIKAWSKIVSAATAPHRASLNPIAFPHKRATTTLVPRGVVGVIAPWNYPVAGLYRSVFPALLCGDGVVVKPSELSPRTSAWFLDHLADVLPPGLVGCVQGGPSVGASLVESGIDACVFTGSTTAGEKVRVRCAELGIPSSIEMGGKDFAIVLADCDMPRTLAGVTHWALSNVGQACGAIEVVCVEESIADEFVRRLASAWKRLRVAPADGEATAVDISPVANQKQLSLIESHVADALSRGAKLACGGERSGRGLGYRPTILDHCDERMRVVEEETFGPVVAILRVAGASEAVRLVNASRYGLGASIWTQDLARAKRLSERLDVGIVSVNNHAFTGAVPALPWSGTRATGFGIANSAYSLTTFARPKVLVVDESRDPEPYFLPYDATLRDLGELLADAQLGRVFGAWRIPLLLRRRLARIRAFFS